MASLRVKRIGNHLLPLIEGNVLDIGSGDCSIGEYLIKNKNISYRGVDIIDYTPKINIKFTKSDMPYPFKDNSFETVLLIFTLHHMDNPEKGLLEAKRLAKKKILILEDVPRTKFERLLMKIVDFLGSKIMNPKMPLPYKFLDDKSWNYLFKKHDLFLKSKKVVHPLPFPRLNHYLYEVEV